jgi:hypothetical protein
MNVVDDTLLISEFKYSIQATTHYNNDPIQVKLSENEHDLTNTVVDIGSGIYHVVFHNTTTGVLHVDSDIKESGSVLLKVYFDKHDLILNGAVDTATGIVLDKNLVIQNTGLYLHDCVLLLSNNSILQVNSGGCLKTNPIKFNNGGNVIKTGLVTITTTGTYGKDNYRKIDKSVVNGNGRLIMNSTWWYQKSASRSDWDITELSTVKLYNFVLSGNSGAYHHLASKNATIDGLIIMDSYSIELMQTPVFMRGFQSINCYYGLSFYPPTGTPVVASHNTEIHNSTITIKRNSRSNLKLINPVIDFSNATFTGSCPIQICYSTSDKLIDTYGNPIPNQHINYLHEPVPVLAITDTTLITNPDTGEINFIYCMPGDSVYVSDSKKGYSGGEYVTVDAINLKTLLINKKLLNEYDIDTCTIRKVIPRISSSDGGVDPVNIPYGFYPRASNVLQLYKPVEKVYFINGDMHKFTVFAYNDATDHLQSNNADSFDTGGEHTSLIVTMNETLNKLVTDLSQPATVFYSNFVEEHKTA